MSMRKPRVLFVSRKFPPSVGGMENFAFQLSESISLQTTLYKITWGGKNTFLPLILPYFLLRSLYILLTKTVDVIHMQDALLAPLGVILKKLFNIPLVVVVHGLDISYDSKIYQAIVPYFVAKADSIICISNAASNEAHKRNVPLSKIKVIPLGTKPSTIELKKNKAKHLATDLINYRENDEILLYVGRLVERKGADWLLENVAPKLLENNHKLKIVIIGTGEREHILREIVNSKNITNKVYLLGRVNDEELEAIYRVASIFVMPNIKVKNDLEGFGIVIHEAATHQLPVVASGMEGILDASKHGENAIHVEPGKATDFIKEIQFLLDNPINAKKFGISADKYTRKTYSWTVIAKKYLKKYKELHEST